MQQNIIKISFVCIIVLLPACAQLPTDFEAPPSYVIDDTDDTLLGKKFKEVQKNMQNEKEKLINKEKLIDWAKTVMYDTLWISENIKSNTVLENFSKWFIDELIFGNADMAIEVINTWWKVLIDAISGMLTLNWLKQMAKSLWESVWKLFSWNAYWRWKSIAELWLVTTWIWAAAIVWKKWIKLWIKRAIRLNKKVESFVDAPNVKKIIWETRQWVDKIVPRKVKDVDSILIEDIAWLKNKPRLESADIFLNKTLNKKQQDAILEAHDIWENRIWSWIWSYNFTEIRKKAIILKKAWFKPDEIRILMEKWICGKMPDKRVNKIDNIDKRADYNLSKMKWMNPERAWKIMGKFTEKIDLEFLINNPKRIDRMLDIVEGMCDYIEWNIGSIREMWKIELQEFTYNFVQLRRQIWSFRNNPSFSRLIRDDFNDIHSRVMVRTYNRLKPYNYNK